MAKDHLIAGLQAIFPTTDLERAGRTATGAIATGRREPAAEETALPNWTALLVVGVAVALLALAVVQNPAKSLPMNLVSPLPSWQDGEPNSESDLQMAYPTY